jgi:hypothetical protein
MKLFTDLSTGEAIDSRCRALPQARWIHRLIDVGSLRRRLWKKTTRTRAGLRKSRSILPPAGGWSRTGDDQILTSAHVGRLGKTASLNCLARTKYHVMGLVLILAV